MGRPTLITPRLRLRRPCPADAARLSALSADPLIPRMTSRIPRDNPPEAVARALAEMEAGGEQVRVVEDAQGVQGMATLGPRGLGYWIGAPARGRGYATETARALVIHGFGALRMARIEAAVFPENAASRRVLEKLGFVPVGTSRAWSVGRGAEAEQIDMVLERAARAPGLRRSAA